MSTSVDTSSRQSVPIRAGMGIRGLGPGLALAGCIVAIASALRMLPGLMIFSPMILAFCLGAAFSNVVVAPAAAKPGIAFAAKKLLRVAIVLLGFQLTATQIAAVGVTGACVIAATLVATFVVTTRLGRWLGVDRKLTELIAAGTSICGASAVLATNTVTKAPDEDVGYAVACVTVFGSLAMLLYPLAPAALHLDAHAFGLWSGASIHEIAQVVGAAFQNGPQSGEFATIAKLTRVMMLAPVVAVIGALAVRRGRMEGEDGARGRAPLPWFVIGFVAIVAVNSVLAIPPDVKAWIVLATTLMLSLSLAAMGLEIDVRRLRANGWKPLLLGALSWLFIASFSLALVKLLA